MAHIIFYTKPGCATAAKQVKLLEESGHKVDVRDLLSHQWIPEELLSYFGELPVAEWFNIKSPRVKEGEINPSSYDRNGALALMLGDHLLINRPLMEAEGKRVCGFDPGQVHAWVGLGETVYRKASGEDYTSCSLPQPSSQQCP